MYHRILEYFGTRTLFKVRLSDAHKIATDAFCTSKMWSSTPSKNEEIHEGFTTRRSETDYLFGRAGQVTLACFDSAHYEGAMEQMTLFRRSWQSLTLKSVIIAQKSPEMLCFNTKNPNLEYFSEQLTILILWSLPISSYYYPPFTP